MKSKQRLFVFFAMEFFSVIFSGCTIESIGPETADSNAATTQSASGSEEVTRIQIDGSSTVKMITAAIGEEFEAKFSDVKIALKVTGTGTGFKEMIAGRIDIANASRSIKESEKADCAKNGIELVELIVALDGLTVCVNKENDWVDAVTTAQLNMIWESGSTVQTWNDVDASWPAVPITLYGPGEESGTFDFFTEAINGKEDAVREDYSPSADDNVTVTGVSGEKGGMGFFGCAYYFANQDKVKALRISPTDSVTDAVAPTPETVKAGKYKPLARPLFIYVKKSSLARQEVQDFVRFYLNGGQKQVSAVGYVDISDKQLKASRDALEAAIEQYQAYDTSQITGMGQSPKVSRRHEKLIQAALFLCAALSVLTTAAIILVLLTNAVYAPGVKMAFFERVSVWDFLTGLHWKPVDGEAGRFGIIPLLCGTMMVALIASLVSVPAGLGAAIYMSEYASPREREFLKPVLEVLAGIPSVVFGFFALKFITPWILKPLFSTIGLNLQIFNTLSAGIVVGIMVTPLIASLSEDVIRSVPRSLREAAFALGSTRFDVSVRIVVPAALSGILAAFLLAFSRAVGETMAVTIAGGQQAIATLNPLQGAQTMTGFMVHASTGDSSADSISRMSVYAVGIALFAMTLTINILSGWILRRYREVYQ